MTCRPYFRVFFRRIEIYPIIEKNDSNTNFQRLEFFNQSERWILLGKWGHVVTTRQSLKVIESVAVSALAECHAIVRQYRVSFSSVPKIAKIVNLYS